MCGLPEMPIIVEETLIIRLHALLHVWRLVILYKSSLISFMHIKKASSLYIILPGLLRVLKLSGHVYVLVYYLVSVKQFFRTQGEMASFP